VYDILLILDAGSQPNREDLYEILTGSDDEAYKDARSRIGRVHNISAPRLSGILDVLLFLGLITYYKKTKLLEITDLGKKVESILSKKINLSKILEVGVREMAKPPGKRGKNDEPQKNPR